jgi:hypothetical protein
MHIYASFSQTLSFSHPLGPSSLTLSVSLTLNFTPSHCHPPLSAIAILSRSQPSSHSLFKSQADHDYRLPVEVMGFSLGWLLFSFLIYHLSPSVTWRWQLITEMPFIRKSPWIYRLSDIGQGGRQKWYSRLRVIWHPPLGMGEGGYIRQTVELSHARNIFPFNDPAIFTPMFLQKAAKLPTSQIYILNLHYK